MPKTGPEQPKWPLIAFKFQNLKCLSVHLISTPNRGGLGTESAIDQRLLAARKKNPGKAFKAKKGGFMTDFGEKTQNFKGHYPFFWLFVIFV